LHRKSHFKAGEAISLDVGTMKITTRLFNEDFINIAKRLHVDGSMVALPGETSSPKQSRKRAVRQDADAEDERLNRLQIMLG